MIDSTLFGVLPLQLNSHFRSQFVNHDVLATDANVSAEQRLAEQTPRASEPLQSASETAKFNVDSGPWLIDSPLQQDLQRAISWYWPTISVRVAPALSQPQLQGEASALVLIIPAPTRWLDNKALAWQQLTELYQQHHDFNL